MIEIQHLRKQFGDVVILDDVNTTINEGDVIAVIGPSGTGKSTLLRCINLLEQPTSGSILLNGEDITRPKCDINRVRRKLGMVFQSFNLYEHLTILENCMLAQTVLLKSTRKQAYDKAMELLKSVGMDEKALQYPYELSGGQKQRAAIARTLSTDPEIILFDEPTSALDPLTVGEVESVIARLSRQGRTMMIVTHSMDFAKRVSNRVFYMDQGGIYEDGTPDEIFNHPKRERTRKFVKQLYSVTMTVCDDNHDMNAEIDKLYAFCVDRGITPKRTVNVCAAYEEFYNILQNYVFGENKTLYVSLEHDANMDILTLSFTAESLKKLSGMEEITDSLEYKLLTHYTGGQDPKTLQTDKGTCYSFEM